MDLGSMGSMRRMDDSSGRAMPVDRRDPGLASFCSTERRGRLHSGDNVTRSPQPPRQYPRLARPDRVPRDDPAEARPARRGRDRGGAARAMRLAGVVTARMQSRLVPGSPAIGRRERPSSAGRWGGSSAISATTKTTRTRPMAPMATCQPNRAIPRLEQVGHRRTDRGPEWTKPLL